MKIRAWGNNSGSQYWRLIHPLRHLNKKYGWEVTINNTKILEDPDLLLHDIYVPQGIVDKQGLEALWIMKNDYGKKIVVDFDDFMKVNKDSPHKKEHEVVDAVRVLRKFAKVADLLTTTNKTLATELKTLNPNVKVIPNYIDLDTWNYPIVRHGTDRVRVGWMGSITHIRDMQLVADVLKQLLHDYPQMDLILMGDWRLKELFENTPRVEVFLGVPFEVYPSKLNGLKIDIGLCPLRNNFFCKCKSPIKWMENTIAGAVTVASPNVYSDVIRQGENGFIANSSKQWYQSISRLIEDKDLRLKVWSKAYGEVTTKYSLANHVDEWKEAYESVL